MIQNIRNKSEINSRQNPTFDSTPNLLEAAYRWLNSHHFVSHWCCIQSLTDTGTITTTCLYHFIITTLVGGVITTACSSCHVVLFYHHCQWKGTDNNHQLYTVMTAESWHHEALPRVVSSSYIHPYSSIIRGILITDCMHTSTDQRSAQIKY